MGRILYQKPLPKRDKGGGQSRTCDPYVVAVTCMLSASGSSLKQLSPIAEYGGNDTLQQAGNPH